MASPAPQSVVESSLSSLARSEEHLRQLGGDLGHAFRLASIGTLTAGIAHEINNMLTPALATMQLARQAPGDSDLQAKAIDRAERALISASKLIHAVLGFARPTRAEEETAVNDALGESHSLLEVEFNRDRIHLIREVPEGLAVRTASHALQQVFLNLLLNAKKAFARRGGTVRIAASSLPSGRVEILVEDDGPGIPEDIRRRLFEPFVTSGHASWPSAPSADHSGNTGLGLTICRYLLEESGGSIRFEPRSPHGARFIIELDDTSRSGKRVA